MRAAASSFGMDKATATGDEVAAAGGEGSTGGLCRRGWRADGHEIEEEAGRRCGRRAPSRRRCLPRAVLHPQA